MGQSSLQSRQQFQQQRTLAGKIQDMSLQCIGSFSTVTSNLTTRVQQRRQLLESTAEVVRTNFQVLQVVLDIQQMLKKIPYQITREQPVYFWDARGFCAPFHLEFINCPEAFLAVIKVRFKDAGLRRIENRQFALSDARTRRDINLDRPWTSCFQPGQTVHMSMIFDLPNFQGNSCPACGCNNPGGCNTEIQCTHCGKYYQRITKLSSSEPSDSKRRAEPAEGRGLQHPKKRRLEDFSSANGPNSESDDDIAEYKRVRFTTSGPETPVPPAGPFGAYPPRRPNLSDILANNSPPPWTLTAFIKYLSQNHCLEPLEFTMDASRYRKHYNKLAGRLPNRELKEGSEECSHIQSLYHRIVDA